jgi:hypothetical protein
LTGYYVGRGWHRCAHHHTVPSGTRLPATTTGSSSTTTANVNIGGLLSLSVGL